jgi:acetylornithine deacetylase/succinyl-diaminopimelate desuccinylase-like protein
MTSSVSRPSNLSQRLEALVRELALPAGRRVGQPGHRIAETWVIEQFTRLGLMPYAETGFALPYTVEGKKFTNLVALIPGRDQSISPLLIGAHYDSVIDAPCADDNAASVALTLEVAAQIRPGQLKHDLIIAMIPAVAKVAATWAHSRQMRWSENAE